jgi:hypothetical protein
MDGYFTKIGTKTTCTNKCEVANCHTCLSTDYSKCSNSGTNNGCDYGYFYDNGACTKCTTDCKECTSAATTGTPCTKCWNAKALTASPGLCSTACDAAVTDKTGVEECTVTSGAKVTRCADGYGIDVDGGSISCKKCFSANCSLGCATNYKECTKAADGASSCDNGYSFENVAADATAKTCD